MNSFKTSLEFLLHRTTPHFRFASTIHCIASFYDFHLHIFIIITFYFSFFTPDFILFVYQICFLIEKKQIKFHDFAAKYFTAVLCMVSMSVVSTVLTLNVHYRHPETHVMGRLVRRRKISLDSPCRRYLALHKLH